MKINELTINFDIFASNEEKKLMPKIAVPVPLSSFSEREQVVLKNMVRKSLAKQIGFTNPKVVINANEQK